MTQTVNSRRAPLRISLRAYSFPMSFASCMGISDVRLTSIDDSGPRHVEYLRINISARNPPVDIDKVKKETCMQPAQCQQLPKRSFCMAPKTCV